MTDLLLWTPGWELPIELRLYPSMLRGCKLDWVGRQVSFVRACENTSSNISSVSRPVNVFCWLGW